MRDRLLAMLGLLAAALTADAVLRLPGGPATGFSTPAFAQTAPDDDPDDDDAEDDDDGGDGVGDDDLGNDAPGDDDAPGAMTPDSPAAPDNDGGDDGDGADDGAEDAAGGRDDDATDDDVAPAAPPTGGATSAAGDEDDDDDDDDAAPGVGPGSETAPADPSGAGSGGSGGARTETSAPGGAGARGASAPGDARVRDGDADRARPERLPDGVDLDDQGQWVQAGEILALAPDARALARARAQGFVEIERYGLQALGLTVVRLRTPAGRAAAPALAALRAADPDTAYDFNHFYRTVQARPAQARPAPRRPATARPALTRSAAAPPPPAVKIGMIDGPVAVSHPALRSADVVRQNFAGPRASQDAAHGTAVASLLVGRDGERFMGAAPDARLLAAAVTALDAGGAELAGAVAIVRGLDWIVAQGAPVVNVSMAGPDNALVSDAVARAIARGVVMVAAVGNDGPAAPARFPAAYPGVVGVTAVDQAGGVFRRAGRGGHIDLAAPGVDVLAAQLPAGYGPQTGTSFAAPRVAAALALRYRRAEPQAAASLAAALEREARDIGAAGRDPVYGAGLFAAVSGAAQ